jgi:hypothetical protein
MRSRIVGDIEAKQAQISRELPEVTIRYKAADCMDL